jgi:hypothetical protein
LAVAAARAFMDRDFVTALLGLLAATDGRPAAVNSTVEGLTGHPARSYATWVADHRADFGGPSHG